MRITGWDTPDLAQCLMSEPKGEISGLDEFLIQFPLAALSADKKHFVVIRDFAFHITKGKIDMTNAKATDENAHKGMTLVTANEDGGNIFNVILPDELEYNKVQVVGREIHICHGNERTITNAQELRKLWSFNKLSEPEILQIFQSLKNEFVAKPEIEKQTTGIVESDHFGVLTLDRKTDRYCCIFNFEGLDIKLSFSNIDRAQLDKNLLTTKALLTKTKTIQSSMVDEMLPVTNEVWLKEHQSEVSKSEFENNVKLCAIHVFEDGSASFYYDTGDLFWGHEILTHVDSMGKYRNSTVAG